jgi:hypothetical protein
MLLPRASASAWTSRSNLLGLGAKLTLVPRMLIASTSFCLLYLLIVNPFCYVFRSLAASTTRSALDSKATFHTIPRSTEASPFRIQQRLMALSCDEVPDVLDISSDDALSVEVVLVAAEVLGIVEADS